VLLGSDFYWKFVTGEVCHGAVGPVAIYSKLGWFCLAQSAPHDLLEIPVHI